MDAPPLIIASPSIIYVINTDAPISLRTANIPTGRVELRKVQIMKVSIHNKSS